MLLKIQATSRRLKRLTPVSIKVLLVPLSYSKTVYTPALCVRTIKLSERQKIQRIKNIKIYIFIATTGVLEWLIQC